MANVPEIDSLVTENSNQEMGIKKLLFFSIISECNVLYQAR